MRPVGVELHAGVVGDGGDGQVGGAHEFQRDLGGDGRVGQAQRLRQQRVEAARVAFVAGTGGDHEAVTTHLHRRLADAARIAHAHHQHRGLADEARTRVLGHRAQRGERGPLGLELGAAYVGVDLEQRAITRLHRHRGLHRELARRGRQLELAPVGGGGAVAAVALGGFPLLAALAVQHRAQHRLPAGLALLDAGHGLVETLLALIGQAADAAEAEHQQADDHGQGHGLGEEGVQFHGCGSLVDGSAALFRPAVKSG